MSGEDGWQGLVLEHEAKRAALEFDLAQREFYYIKDNEQEPPTSGRYKSYHAKMIAANDRHGKAVDAFTAWWEARLREIAQ